MSPRPVSFPSFAFLLLVLLVAGCDGSATVAPPADDPLPATGVYAATQFPASAIRVVQDVAYSVRPNAGRQYTSGSTREAEERLPQLTLRMDIGVPPNATATSRQPLLVFIHGGGFVTGDKRDFLPEMEAYARAGYVVASVNYRLTPGNQQSDTLRSTTVTQALEDVANAVRWLRANAARYGIDTTRVASVGSSAGGALSLLLAIQPDDPRLRYDDPLRSSRVNGAVSTGATLAGETEAVLSFISYDATDAPVLLLHARETDGGTGATWTGSVLPTQARINASGNRCTVVPQPNGTHTVDLSLGNTYWPSVGPFLFSVLRLTALRG